MNGSASRSVTKIAKIFGTNTSVCSWIWVSAWNSDTTTPTTRPTPIKGDDTTTMVQIASRATSRVSGPVIVRLAFSSCFVVPGRCEASNPESRDSGLALRAPRNDKNSNRHLHDVLIGRDHPVADRDQRRDSDIGFGNRRHHVHHIGLALRHRDGLRIRLAPDLADA